MLNSQSATLVNLRTLLFTIDFAKQKFTIDINHHNIFLTSTCLIFKVIIINPVAIRDFLLNYQQ